MHCQACLGKVSKKFYLGVFKIFEKALKMKNCPKIIMVVVARKKPILGIAIGNFNKTLSVPRTTLDERFESVVVSGNSTFQ